MSKTAESVLRDLPALAPAELQQVRDEASRLLTQQAQTSPRHCDTPSTQGERTDATGSPPGRLIRPMPPAGHPGGSLERDDPFFEILHRIEEERHQRRPRAPVRLEI